MTTFIPPIAPPMLFPPLLADRTVYSTPYTAAVLADSPKAWWRFNDVSGATIVDTQGFANGVENSPAATLYQQAGLITEVGQTSQGAVNSAASFLTATIPAGVPLAGGWTLEYWTAVQPVAGFQNAVGIFTDGPSQVLFAPLDGTGAGAGLIGATPIAVAAAGCFTTLANYFAVTFDGANTRFYKNGVLLATSAVALTGTRVSTIGTGAGATGGAKFGGFMDEMALYASQLSATRLLAHYNAGLAAIVSSIIPGTEQQSKTGGLAAPPNWPPLTPQAPIATVLETWPNGPPAAATRPSAAVDPYTTQDQTNTFFRIISPRPGSGT